MLMNYQLGFTLLALAIIEIIRAAAWAFVGWTCSVWLEGVLEMLRRAYEFRCKAIGVDRVCRSFTTKIVAADYKEAEGLLWQKTLRPNVLAVVISQATDLETKEDVTP